MKKLLILSQVLLLGVLLLNGCIMGGHHLTGEHHTRSMTATAPGNQIEKEITTPTHRFIVQIPPLFSSEVAHITFQVVDNENGIPVSGVNIRTSIREFPSAGAAPEKSDGPPTLNFPAGQTESDGFHHVEYKPTNAGSAEIAAEFWLPQSSGQETVTLQATQPIIPSRNLQKRNSAWVPFAILGGVSMVAMMIISMGLWH